MAVLVLVTVVGSVAVIPKISRSEELLPPVDKFALWTASSSFRGAMITPVSNRTGRPGLGPTLPITIEDLRALKLAGANTVMLLYPNHYGVNAPYAFNAENLANLQKTVDLAWEVGLYVVINIEDGPGRPADPAFVIDTKDETLWYSEEEQTRWVDTWMDLAFVFKDYPNVIGYDLLAEPHPESPIIQPPAPPTVWFNLAKRITTAIRAIDPLTPIIVESTLWGNPKTFPAIVPTGDTKTIYSVHMFAPSSFTAQGLVESGSPILYSYPGFMPSDDGTVEYWDKARIAKALLPVRDFQTKNGVPIFVGEFGCNRKVVSCINHLRDSVSLFEEYGWSHTFSDWRTDDEFDYEKEPTGTERVPESSYMKMIKPNWAKNSYFF